MDDTSKDFDSGDGTKENPFLIMNARQLDNVRKYLQGIPERSLDFCYFKIGRDIDLTEYYGATWAEQGWTEDMAGCPWDGLLRPAKRYLTEISTGKAIQLPD